MNQRTEDRGQETAKAIPPTPREYALAGEVLRLRALLQKRRRKYRKAGVRRRARIK